MDFCMIIITSLDHYDDLASTKVDVCHCVCVWVGGGCMSTCGFITSLEHFVDLDSQ